MNSYVELQELVKKERILFSEPMKKHTTFQVGGPSDCLIFVESEEDLHKLLPWLNEKKVPFFVLGNGSNLLVSDEGYKGVVLETRTAMNAINVEGNKIYAQAGALLSKVASVALQNALTGFEFAAGIPGTIGGSVIMNAGAYGGEMSQVVTRVETMTLSGEKRILTGEEMEFSYRKSKAKTEGLVVTGVELLLHPGDKDTIKETMDELARKRKEKQPLEYPSAGSTFKRPTGYFAGKLIEEAGLRGFCVGGAQVSEKHCGFVVNKGNATAEDINKLMIEVTEKVKENSNVTLEPEVIRIGEF